MAARALALETWVGVARRPWLSSWCYRRFAQDEGAHVTSATATSLAAS